MLSSRTYNGTNHLLKYINKTKGIAYELIGWKGVLNVLHNSATDIKAINIVCKAREKRDPFVWSLERRQDREERERNEGCKEGEAGNYLLGALWRIILLKRRGRFIQTQLTSLMPRLSTYQCRGNTAESSGKTSPFDKQHAKQSPTQTPRSQSLTCRCPTLIHTPH